MEDRSRADEAMERHARGEPDAFAEVYDAVAPRLLSFLRRQVRSAALAEDILQQTLLQMHRARGTFISGSPVVPWAFAIARRLVIDESRREKRNVLSTSEADLHGDADRQSADQEGLVAARQLARRLQEELSRLPKSQQTAFEMMRLEGLSYPEAAEALGVTVGTLKTRVHRAYVALRGIIDHGGAEPETEP